jgi:asparagine synthase (glutamine-hydrolysing)
MCGIAGFWQDETDTPDVLSRVGNAMNETLRHRGPDDGALWMDAPAGLTLAFRRLAIVDLSEGGRQPMVSHCGRYVIAFNGEIYNHHDLRRALEREGQAFSSTSDTEVLVNACAEWGVERTLNQCNGMFGFALWDREDHTLTLARDRMGKKPVYYGWHRNTFLFASELKALRRHPAFVTDLDRRSLALFLRMGYIPAPYSMYAGIFKLRAGHMLTVSTARQHVAQRPYWSAQAVVENARRQPFTGTAADAAEELHALLLDSVRLRMLADVPVGAFLSGGIDSSLAVALMQAQATSGVKTFTIGFKEDSHDEAQFASNIARHLGTDHTQLILSADEARDMIPLMAATYDEPFADSSQIPTYLVSRLARQRITVSLSGDGGDELFGGYEEYQRSSRRWRILRRLLAARPFIRGCIKGINGITDRQFLKLEQLFEVTTLEALHHFQASRWRRPAELLPGAVEYHSTLIEPHAWSVEMSDIERMMFMDLVCYLPEDILTKLDRASMAVSLESRVPLLDYRVVEFAWRLPMDFKIHRGRGKQILRAILGRYVPPQLFERPKMGFNMPLQQWLRGPLRPWVEELLSPSRLREQNVFDPVVLRAAWADLLSGRQRSVGPLWGVLMFQAWQHEWMEPVSV